MREIFSIGIDHNSCDPSFIAEYSLGENEGCGACARALQTEGVDEFFTLSTCNRVEIFAVGEPQKLFGACLEAATLGGLRDPQKFLEKARILKNKDAIVHLFETASGLNSQMVGETEILGQIKKAYAAEKIYCKAVLNRALQKAMQCAKWIRTNTEIGSGSTTIGSVAAEVASRIFEDVKKTKILLAGSGEVGRSVAMALAARGAENITVASRTWEKARALSDDVGGSAINFERIAGELGKYDIAIFALSNAAGIINFDTAQKAEQLRNASPIFIMDLAVPRNVCAECAGLGGVFLYDLEDLSKAANENLQARMGEIEKAKNIIEKKAQYLCDRLGDF
ncbi:MAG: glutamyl-tRNA reductase [Opitutales bacterium]|nr:glutamyl-tRNA reductase [Opitutales bacterium]